MGNINHLRLVVTGENKQSDLAGEIWQFGVNWMPTLGSPMADIFTPDLAFDTSYNLGSTSGTGYVAERNYILEGGVNDLDPMDWLVNQVAPAIQTYLGSTIFTNQNYVTMLEAYPIGADGLVVKLPQGPAKAVLSTTVNTWDGGGTTVPCPPFVTFACSTVSVANIPRGRGRWFPPAPVASSLDSGSGLVSSSTRTTLAAASTAFLEACALNVGPGDLYLRPCIIGSPWTTAYAITGVRIGSLPDTQRRRKNGLAESYTLDNCSF